MFPHFRLPMFPIPSLHCIESITRYFIALRLSRSHQLQYQSRTQDSVDDQSKYIYSKSQNISSMCQYASRGHSEILHRSKRWDIINGVVDHKGHDKPQTLELQILQGSLAHVYEGGHCSLDGTGLLSLHPEYPLYSTVVTCPFTVDKSQS